MIAVLPAAAAAQGLTIDMLRPTPGANISAEDSLLRRTSPDLAPAPETTPAAPSRIGRAGIFTDDSAPASSVIGFDSANRRKPAKKPYPGAPRVPTAGLSARPQVPVQVGRPVIAAPPSQFANKPPVSPSITGSVPGQPLRRRLPVDADPFGPVGIRVGSFIVKPAVEIGGGYESNPGRFTQPRGSSFYRIAPELLAATDWSRHSVTVDLRGSYTGFTKTFPSAVGQVSSVPVEVDRIEFNGRVAGRLDVNSDTRLNGEFRTRVGQDNPGSPNVQVGLQRYPLYASYGVTGGVEQDFNRLRLRADALADRVSYQDSRLTDGSTAGNRDRDYNQFGGVGRVSYELTPGLRPFGEVQGNVRIHDSSADRFGYLRDSSGGYLKVGTTFEFSRLVTGEASVGYGARRYTDSRLNNLTGLLASASLVWSATPLTTVSFLADTSVDETTIPGVAGVLTRTFSVAVNHDFRRLLTGIGRFTFGTQNYQGGDRNDQFYSISGDVVYRLNREMQLKATVRHDRLNSNIANASTGSTVVLLGVRLQR